MLKMYLKTKLRMVPITPSLVHLKLVWYIARPQKIDTCTNAKSKAERKDNLQQGHLFWLQWLLMGHTSLHIHTLEPKQHVCRQTLLFCNYRRTMTVSCNRWKYKKVRQTLNQIKSWKRKWNIQRAWDVFECKLNNSSTNWTLYLSYCYLVLM